MIARAEVIKFRRLRSVGEIIDIGFGGHAAAARWANTYPSTVYNWLAADEIPNGWHYRIHLEMERRGYRIDPAVFVPGIGRMPKRVAR